MDPVDVSDMTGRLQLVIFIQRLQLGRMVQRVPLVTIIPSNINVGMDLLWIGCECSHFNRGTL
jgi:hypothetical protein